MNGRETTRVLVWGPCYSNCASGKNNRLKSWLFFFFFNSLPLGSYGKLRLLHITPTRQRELGKCGIKPEVTHKEYFPSDGVNVAV